MSKNYSYVQNKCFVWTITLQDWTISFHWLFHLRSLILFFGAGSGGPRSKCVMGAHFSIVVGEMHMWLGTHFHSNYGILTQQMHTCTCCLCLSITFYWTMTQSPLLRFNFLTLLIYLIGKGFTWFAHQMAWGFLWLNLGYYV